MKRSIDPACRIFKLRTYFKVTQAVDLIIYTFEIQIILSFWQNIWDKNILRQTMGNDNVG